MFLVTVLVENIASKRQKLFNDILSASGIAQKYNCALKRLDFQQEQGLMSSLALGLNQIEIERGLTTSSTAIFVPFTTCELFQEGEALYYGLNALSNNLIMANRKNLKNPNGLFLGTPGSGKSFSAKREIVNVFLLTEDDIIIADPEMSTGLWYSSSAPRGRSLTFPRLPPTISIRWTLTWTIRTMKTPSL